MHSTEILLKIATITELNSTKNDYFFLLKVYGERNTGLHVISNAKLQATKQALITSKRSIEFNYSDFSRHLNVNRDKIAFTNRRWKCKKAKD